MPKKRPILASSILALAAAHTPTLAWGVDGHSIVAWIAEQDLEEVAAAEVARLLDGDSMVDVCVWADAVRGTDEYRWSAPHHYVNVAPSAAAYLAQRDNPEQGCAVSAIETHAATLRSSTATDEQKAEALRFIIHFVGDLHQPLHAGRGADRGGNSIRITLNGVERNLHSAWDSGILDARPQPWPLRADALYKGIDDELRGVWSDPLPSNWATESYQLALAFVYPSADDGVVDEAEIDLGLAISNRQLQKAGTRLAQLLNDIYPTPTTETTTDTTPDEPTDGG